MLKLLMGKHRRLPLSSECLYKGGNERGKITIRVADWAQIMGVYDAQRPVYRIAATFRQLMSLKIVGIFFEDLPFTGNVRKQVPAANGEFPQVVNLLRLRPANVLTECRSAGKQRSSSLESEPRRVGVKWLPYRENK
jgi:hypothetical protein